METILGTLQNGPVLLGRLFHSYEVDVPEFSEDSLFIRSSFEATHEFSRFRALFDGVLSAIKNKDEAQEELSWRKINSLGLTLKLNEENKKFTVRAPIEPGDTVSLFQNAENAQLYIDYRQEKVWFRLW
jgi:hypothetical protein